jgi:hypothetical protein
VCYTCYLYGSKEAIKKGMLTVLTRKNYFAKLCLNLTAIGVFAVVASLAIQTTVSAKTTLGGASQNVLSHSVMSNPNATTPNDTCDATGDGGCNVTFSGTLAGALSVTIGAATITPPATLDGTAQSAPFTFVTNVADTRGVGASPWALSAASDGLTVSTISGTSMDPFVVTDVTASCTTDSSCSNAAITAGTGSIASTAGAYATAPDGGDLGTTTVTVDGNVPLGTDTVGGAYSGTITITAGPTL